MAGERLSKYDYLLKILLVGNSGVGKTSMTFRAINNTFATNVASTLGIDFQTKFVNVSGKRVKLQIWDTSGQERFWAVTTHFFRGAKGALLVYDITDEKSFQDMTRWLKSIQDNTDPDIEIIIIGNKCDKENDRVVSKEEGKILAEQNHCVFFETSAKSNTNIEFAFEQIASKIMKAHLEGEIHLACHDLAPAYVSKDVSNLSDVNQNMNNARKCCR